MADEVIRVKRDGFRFQISDESFDYLIHQRGDIHDFCTDRECWERAYHASIFDAYESMARFLPERCARIVDIGAGLGGIDAVLNKHYGGFVEICPIDGEKGEPTGLDKKARMLTGEKQTRGFLNANGVTRVSYFLPTALPKPMNAKLVISIASWCFHYPPGIYLSFVKQSLAPGGVLIVDVRRDKPWREVLQESFEEIGIAFKGKKADRIVYAA